MAVFIARCLLWLHLFYSGKAVADRLQCMCDRGFNHREVSLAASKGLLATKSSLRPSCDLCNVSATSRRSLYAPPPTSATCRRRVGDRFTTPPPPPPPPLQRVGDESAIALRPPPPPPPPPATSLRPGCKICVTGAEFLPTLCRACNYLSMLVLIQVDNRGHWVSHCQWCSAEWR